jgi:hypothetical protein
VSTRARLIVLLSVLAAGAAQAGQVEFAARDIKTVFFFTTSDNKTHIDYGLRMAANCVPQGDEPLFPYWRDYDTSPAGEKTNALKFYEYAAYGVAEQTIKRLESRTELGIKLKALPRPIVITIEPGPGGACRVTPRAAIGGQPNAVLLSAHIQLKTGWSVDYVEVRGRTDEGKNLTERLLP